MDLKTMKKVGYLGNILDFQGGSGPWQLSEMSLKTLNSNSESFIFFDSDPYLDLFGFKKWIQNLKQRRGFDKWL